MIGTFKLLPEIQGINKDYILQVNKRIRIIDKIISENKIKNINKEGLVSIFVRGGLYYSEDFIEATLSELKQIYEKIISKNEISKKDEEILNYIIIDIIKIINFQIKLDKKEIKLGNKTFKRLSKKLIGDLKELKTTDENLERLEKRLKIIEPSENNNSKTIGENYKTITEISKTEEVNSEIKKDIINNEDKVREKTIILVGELVKKVIMSRKSQTKQVNEMFVEKSFENIEKSLEEFIGYLLLIPAYKDKRYENLKEYVKRFLNDEDKENLKQIIIENFQKVS